MNEITSGIDYFHFLVKIDKMLSQTPEIVMENLKKTAKCLFTQKSFHISFGCEEEDLNKVNKLRDFIYQNLESGRDRKLEKFSFDKNPSSLGFTANSTVQYNIFSADYKKLGYSYNGKMQVLRTILNLEYLWNEVRVKGGAYGSGCSFQQNGICYFYSYRDPNVTETYEIYKDLWKKVDNFNATDREMTKYILGTINRLDQPKTNAERLNDAINKENRDFPEDFEITERNQIIHTTKNDIWEFRDLLRNISTVKNYCTIGSEGKIVANKEFFDSIQKLIP